ncbi:N5-glutamine methyltransferase family protein [Paenibacillus sp. 1P07SE]|uniref:N5-glutamine methyltransferase family protein n=1 Tax=Paenibacillus sp. 1P07SE TaxID=3132209 RepID=UPI0039A42048
MQDDRADVSELVHSAELTLREACLQASSLLEAAGVTEPRANAELLLLHVLGIERAQLMRDWREPMPLEHWETWRQLIARKAAGEPVQYIIGEGWFYGRAFAVTPAVLIPRPETELLVEAVLEAADRLWPASSGSSGAALTGAGDAASGGVGGLCGGAPGAQGTDEAGSGRIDDSTLNGTEPRFGADADPRALTVLDIGTGSGAIALTLAAERPAWRLYASDLSADALAVAGVNAASLGVEEQVTFVQGDLLAPFMQGGAAEGLSPALAGLTADIVVSNPPYIPAGDLLELQREVRDFEPHLALVGGDDGLDPYRRMIGQLKGMSRLPRIVAFELGMGQAREVARLLEEAFTWREVRIIEDYAGIERHVLALK